MRKTRSASEDRTERIDPPARQRRGVGIGDVAAGASRDVAGGDSHGEPMMSVSATSQTSSPTPSEQLTLLLRGGATTPRRARMAVDSWLDSGLTHGQRSAIALIISELVTNSVVHANVGSDSTLTVEAATREDRLLIAVTDPGSDLEPRVPPHAAGKHRHLG